jgi:acyl-CoA thioesterase-1
LTLQGSIAKLSAPEYPDDRHLGILSGTLTEAIGQQIFMSDFKLQDGQTFLFVGDSITDCGRRDAHKPLGEGYARRATELITARYPERAINFINTGISGNTVQNLRDRWHDDVLNYQPDWVSIKIGINDLHRTLAQTPEATPPDVYETAYRGILERTRKSGAKIVLIDPFYISTETDASSFRKEVLDFLPEYLAIVEKLVKEFETLHVRTHELFVQQLKYRPADYFCPEPVHPYASGHLIIAHGLLEVLGW